jgi:signal transduction histidine kinase
LYKLRIFVLVFFHLSFLKSFSQNSKIDSLRTIIFNYEATNPSFERDTVYIQHLLNLSANFRYINLDSVIVYAETSKKLSDTIGYKYGILASNKEIGNGYMLKGDYERAKEIHLKNLVDTKLNKEHKLVTETYNSICYIYIRNSNYPMAYKTSLEAIDYAYEHKDYKNTIIMKLNVGVMFSLLRDFENSLRYFNDCLKYQEIYDIRVNEGMVHANIGYSYLHLKEYQKAIDHLNKALDIFKKSQIPQWQAFTYVTLGKVFFEKNDLKKALEFFRKAENEHKQIEDKKGTIDMKIGLANTYFLLKQPDLAKQYAEKAKVLAEDHRYLEGLLGSSEILYKLSKSNNSWKESLVHLEYARKIGDSISFEENRNILLMDEARLNYKKEKDNIKALADNTIAKQKKYVAWALIAFFIAVLAALLIYRSNRMAKHLNKKLADQAQTLSESQRSLNRINKNQEKLFSIVGHDLRGPIVSLKELVGLSLESDSGEEYFLRFAPKLKNDLDHIHFMLDNLLNWGQNQMMGATLKAETIDVRDEMTAIIQLFQKNIETKKITLNNNIENGTKVLLDLNHFCIIFRNLISNAIKFTQEHGTIDINGTGVKNQLKITIRDNGVGMSKEVQEKLFKNAEHYTTFGTNNERGTGLGLLLCKEMIEKNNGTIYVESELGKGSEFHIYLPTNT